MTIIVRTYPPANYRLPLPHPPAGEAGIADEVQGLPWYRLGIRIDPDQWILEGSEELVFANQEDVPLEDVVLRLYENATYADQAREGRDDTRVTNATVDGTPVEVRYTASNTAVVVPLPQPLAPGDTARLTISFTNCMGVREGDPPGWWRVASFFPQLAVHDATGWRLDLNAVGDLVFSESANYIMALTLPEDAAVAVSGTVMDTQPNADSTTTHIVLGLGMRDVALIFGDLEHSQTTADGTTINLWHPADDPRVDTKLRVAAEALQIFNDRFGAYPYAEFDIVTQQRDEFATGGAGHEDSGLVTHSHGEKSMLHALVHEIAHLWWFDLVGNDTQLEPWLDEALANYSTFVYFQAAEGEETAQRVLDQVILSAYDMLRQENRSRANRPIGGTVYEFDQYPYFAIVYGKGTLFFDELRQTMGDDAFFTFLQQYHRRFRYAVVTREDFQAVTEKVAGEELDGLFDEWVGRSERE